MLEHGSSLLKNKKPMLNQRRLTTFANHGARLLVITALEIVTDIVLTFTHKFSDEAF